MRLLENMNELATKILGHSLSHRGKFLGTGTLRNYLEVSSLKLVSLNII